MTRKIDVTLNVSEAKAVSAWLRYRNSIEAVNQEMNQTGRVHDKNKQKAQSYLSTVKKMGIDALTSFTGIGSAIAGIATAAAFINQQHQTLIQREKERSVVSQEFGQVMRGVRVAFQPDKTLSDKELETQIEILAKKTRTNPNIFGTALVDTFSAKGSRSNQDALNAQEAAFQLTPGDLDSGRTLAARALDLANNFGIENMKANVGFMQNIQNVARLTSLEKVGSNLLPGIIATTAYKDTPEQAAELGVTLNKLMVDAEGLQTRTALISMADQLSKYVPEKDGKDERGKFKVPAEQIAAYADAGNTTERVAVMQQFPELQRQFFSGASFEKRAIKAVESLLIGTDVAKTQYKTTREQINPLDENQVKTFDDKLASIAGGKYEKGLRAVETSKANTVSNQLGDEASAIKGSARTIYEKTLENTSNFPEVQKKQTDWFRGVLGKSQRQSDIEIYIKALEAEKTWETQKDKTYIDGQIESLKNLEKELKKVEPPTEPYNILKDTAGGIRSLVTDKPRKKISYQQLNNVANQFGFGSKPEEPAAPVTPGQPFYEEKLTRALETATVVIGTLTNAIQDNKTKPVQVDVKFSADTSTAPNGPRTSASLARPAK